jgi:acyl-coenzyme A synthetase/AMP-(fatty) acid ligase
MRTPCNSFRRLRDAIDDGETPPTGHWIGVEHCVPLADLRLGSAIAAGTESLAGRSVLIASTDPFHSALALYELDGLARRIVLCPPDLALDHLPYVMHHAEVDAVVSDGIFLAGAALGALPHFPCSPRLVPRVPASAERLTTEWILLTSGTTGRPKMVLHTLNSLAGAIGLGQSQNEVIWSTFYDIRRYGGMQIYLRAMLTRSSLVLPGPKEPLATFLQRAGIAGVTHISGTPSHWRRALMCPEAHCISPRYIRLSGEIADQGILNSLRSCYPAAEISHAFATTEAGVAFDVRDELSGFPESVLTSTSGVDLKVVDGTLRVRSGRTAERYLGENPPRLKDPDGFVDTGDVVELRDGRYHFQGRRDGVINVGGLKVHPEEVEAVLNRHPQVRLSLVKTKKNPITGSLVVADVLLKETSAPEREQSLALQQSIQQFCRQSLAPHKVPALIRFVPALAFSETGKLVRHHA